MNFEITYEDKVGKMLLDLKIEEIYELEKKVKPENIKKFTDCVKSYIDRNFGNNEGWEIIFSNDYKCIKKQNYGIRQFFQN